MNRYRIIKRVKKLIESSSAYINDTIINPTEARGLVYELDALIKTIRVHGNKFNIPKTFIDRLVIFLEALKEYTGVQKSNHPQVSRINNIKGYLMQELGVKQKTPIQRKVDLPKYLLI